MFLFENPSGSISGRETRVNAHKRERISARPHFISIAKCSGMKKRGGRGVSELYSRNYLDGAFFDFRYHSDGSLRNGYFSSKCDLLERGC
ncbi:hypothetical protein PUN28_002474 [Cardiocondyla obscurior]|uniref:Uncharacterized protein n=1 Tax=Cardiocondyla obscurior TaxID=286306 RepID=A0AAW2GUN4_9HYME